MLPGLLNLRCNEGVVPFKRLGTGGFPNPRHNTGKKSGGVADQEFEIQAGN